MGKNTALVLAGVAVVCAGMVLCIVGLATAYWMVGVYEDQDWHLGLFDICAEGVCIPYMDMETAPDFSRTIAGLCLGVAATGIAIFLGIIHLILGLRNTTTRNFAIVAFITSVIGGISAIAGVIIFYALDRHHDALEKYDIKLDYSCHLSLAGGIAMLIGGVVVLTSRGNTQAANVVVVAPPQHNVVAMQNTTVYGYDQGQFNPSPPPYLHPDHTDYSQK